jgi:fructose-bisphosphate aldolase class 1
MMRHHLEGIVAALVADGKGILALHDHALEAWHGRDENLAAGRQALYQRARCNSAASLGKYRDEMETTPVSAPSPPHRREWRDD